MNIFLPAFVYEFWRTFCVLDRIGVKWIRASFVTGSYVVIIECRSYIYVCFVICLCHLEYGSYGSGGTAYGGYAGYSQPAPAAGAAGGATVATQNYPSSQGYDQSGYNQQGSWGQQQGYGNYGASGDQTSYPQQGWYAFVFILVFCIMCLILPCVWENFVHYDVRVLSHLEAGVV
jgi:hypothetical protein